MAIEEIIKNKKYKVRVAFRDGFGKPQARDKIVYGTEKDAIIQEDAMQKEMATGISGDITFKKLFDAYHKSKPNVKPDSLRKETEIYEKFLISISNRKIDAITPFHLITLRNNIESMDGSITQKNKSIYLLKSIYKFGKRAFGFNDIAADIETIKSKVKQVFKYNTLTPEEFEEVISFEKIEVYRLAFELYFWAGLRRGEALALYKKDLLKSKEVDIYNSVNSQHKIGPPKNESSYRRVLLHDDLFTRLLPHANSKGTYLLGGEEFLAPNTVNRRFTACLNKTNKERVAKGINTLPHIRLHDLRHSHATFLASQNIPITVVSARLGHSSVTETMNTYIHLFKGDDLRVIETIDSYFDTSSKSANFNNYSSDLGSLNLKDRISAVVSGERLSDVEDSFEEILNDFKQKITL